MPTLSEMLEEKLVVYSQVHVFTFLYTGDTVLVVKSANQLLNHLKNYCKKWNLRKNIEKSKVLIISEGNNMAMKSLIL